MRWADLERRQPRLGELARRRLLEPGVVLVATIRRDGTPRLSPVEPWLMDGELWLSMLWGSLKAGDLRRDPRVLVHSIVTGPEGGEGELKLRGRAVTEERAEVQQRYAADVTRHLDWSPIPGRFHLFRVDFDSVAFVRYDHATGDQFTASWPPAKEFVRRGTSATSLGEPEPGWDILDPDID
jgi:Pyridoxamine 5'-phosphate oxidase